jgi:hypothetical protein
MHPARRASFRRWLQRIVGILDEAFEGIVFERKVFLMTTAPRPPAFRKKEFPC